MLEILFGFQVAIADWRKVSVIKVAIFEVWRAVILDVLQPQN